MKFVDLRNTTDVPQTCLHDGALHVIGAKEEATFNVGLAEAFLSQCPGAIEMFENEEVNEVEERGFRDDGYVWVANMTGNPDLPETVTVDGPYSKEKRQWTKEAIPNPKLQPVTQQRWFDLGEEEYRTVQGVFARNLGRELIAISPYKRMRLPENVAKWFLRRDGRGQVEHRGAVIESRQPSSFEPTNSWELDDIKLWVSLIEPSIAAKIKTTAQCPTERDLLDEKKLALRRAFFLAANPKYPLPSRAKFDSLRNTLKNKDTVFAEEDNDSEESAFMTEPKKRGRPRKDADA
jgi:hypothetical protein